MTHGSELQGQEEAACMCIFWPTFKLHTVYYYYCLCKFEVIAFLTDFRTIITGGVNYRY